MVCTPKFLCATTKRMSRVIAVANQKGGVGKTTSVVSLSAEFARLGRKVLVVDFDPQGNASSGLGVSANEEGQDLYDMFFRQVSLAQILKTTDINDLDVAPSSSDLVGIEIEIGKSPGRELILRSEISQVMPDRSEAKS